MVPRKMYMFYIISTFCIIVRVQSSDITNAVFANVRDVLPAAFGDFNSDELTDVFVLRNKSRTVEVLLAADEEPLLRPQNLRCGFSQEVQSVVPGDFDGDAFMDILVTTAKSRRHRETNVYILWGGLDHVNCTEFDSEPLIRMNGEPLALDYNQDMIIDLFGLDEENRRSFWVFQKGREKPKHILMKSRIEHELRHPHSHAYIDLNSDHAADLFLTTKEDFEIWYGAEVGNDGFKFERSIPHPKNVHNIGQSTFADIELVGRLDLLLPVCLDSSCLKSAVFTWSPVNDTWSDLHVNFRDPGGVTWRYPRPEEEDTSPYSAAVTLRAGDFNMDGYPDLLVTLVEEKGGKPYVYLMENVPCTGSSCGGSARTYAVQWKALQPLSNGSAMAVFYDFYQDGVLDVMIARADLTAAAFKNSLDYDANFVKVMVVTGLTNPRSPTVVGRLGRKKRTYGTNLPGPRISYHTITQEGRVQHGASAQLPQSAHHALCLPYTMFGLGRTPNFVDIVTVGLSNRSRDWTQIIPNSQMVVIPWPIDQPSRWRAQLFVTPSKLILMSVAALTAVCGLITVIIAALYWRERQQDKRERLQESHRFHFDAM